MSKIISPPQGLIRSGRSSNTGRKIAKREQKCPLLTSPQSQSDSSLDSLSDQSDPLSAAEENRVPNMPSFAPGAFRSVGTPSSVSSSTSISKAAERRRMRARAAAAKVEAGAPLTAQRQEQALRPPSSFHGLRTSVTAAPPATGSLLDDEEQSEVSAYSAQSSMSSSVGVRHPQHQKIFRRPPPLSVLSDMSTGVPTQRPPEKEQEKPTVLESPREDGCDTPSNGGGVYIPIISPITGQNVATGQSGALQFVPAYPDSANPISGEDSVASSAESGRSSRSGSGAGGRTSFHPKFEKALAAAKSSTMSSSEGKVTFGAAAERSVPRPRETGGTSWDQCVEPMTPSQPAKTMIGTQPTRLAGKDDTSIVDDQSTVTSDSFATDFHEYEQNKHGHEDHPRNETHSENSFVATKHQAGTSIGAFRRRNQSLGAGSAAAITKGPRDAFVSPPKRENTSRASPGESLTPLSSGSKKGRKVARLASLFSSRAVVKGGGVVGGKASGGNYSNLDDGDNTGRRQRGEVNKHRIKTTIEPNVSVPHSPSHSSVSGSGSSAYVGWPGTQDKRGGTVAIQPSYDDSEEGTLSQSKNRVNNTKEMNQAASGQMQNWMIEKGGEEKKSSGEENSYASDYQREKVVGASGRRSNDSNDYDETVPYEYTEDPADIHLAAAVATAYIANKEVEDGGSYSETSAENPADYYLASAVASVASSSPPEQRNRHDRTQELPTQQANSSEPREPQLKRSRNPTSENRQPFTNATNSSRRRSPEPINLSNKGSPTNQENIRDISMLSSPINSAGTPQTAWTTPQSKHSRRGGGSEGGSSKGGISIQNLFGSSERRKAATISLDNSTQKEDYETKDSPLQPKTGRALFKHDPWDIDGSSSKQSPNLSGKRLSHGGNPASSSHNSSSHQHPPKGDIRDKPPRIDTSASERRMRNSGRGEPIRLRPPSHSRRMHNSINPKHQPPTEAALAANEQMSPSPLRLNAHNIKGFRPFLEKTKDVPNLIDDLDSESQTSASTRDTSIFSGLMGKSHTGGEMNSASLARSLGHGNTSDTQHMEEDTESDVFDDLSTLGADSSFSRMLRDDDNTSKTMARESSQETTRLEYNRRSQSLSRALGAAAAKPEKQQDDNAMNVVMVGSGLAALQSSPEDFEKRETSFEFDGNLTDTDVDQHELNEIPARSGRVMKRGISVAETRIRGTDSNRHDEESGLFGTGSMPFTGETNTDTSSSASSYASEEDLQGEAGEFDLSIYSVHPHSVRKLVRRFREFCDTSSSEDAKKSFALFEMRSRIMETDIERGLERQGGTVPVDDLVLTPYNQAACRIRDAVIVSKAWRDGASPRDVITASLLTRQSERKYFVKRPVLRSYGTQQRQGRTRVNRTYTFEEIKWIDDTDFVQFRCPSLGPRCMRGFEMFTIGDCQSILLKLTNERCVQLRKELKRATARQLEAEKFMKEEAGGGNDCYFDDDGTMTDAEDSYLTAMEEVKVLSKQLVVAEKAFQLVRDRIESLVATYQDLLVKLENDSDDESVNSESEASSNSAYSGDNDDYDSLYDEEEEQDREKQLLARRAQRAELKAEVAAREAAVAKQEAEKIKEEKQRELEKLQRKLAQLETKSAYLEEEYERLEADRRSAFGGSVISRSGSDAKSFLLSAHSMEKDPKSTERVKAKFRSRNVQRKEQAEPDCEPGQSYPAKFEYGRDGRGDGSERETNRNRQNLIGEEMYQHLDFYERSLKAVEGKNAFGN